MNDLSNYRKMAKPFDSRADAGAAIQAFLADVIKARQKHRIANVAIVVGVRVENEDGYTVQMQELGSSLVTPGLLVNALKESVMSMTSALVELMPEDKAKEQLAKS